MEKSSGNINPLDAFEDYYGRKPYSKPYRDLDEDKRLQGWLSCWHYLTGEDVDEARRSGKNA